MSKNDSLTIFTGLDRVRVFENPSFCILKEVFHIELLPLESFTQKGLVLKDTGLEFQSLDQRVSLDWERQLNYHRRQNYVLKKQLLARALGIKGNDYRVIDLTCGTGKDTLLLLSFGVKVCAFERNPLIFSLLSDQYHYQKLRSEIIANNLSLNYGSFSRNFFEQQAFLPNAFYFDPMFTSQNRKKSALKRQEMMIFEELVGDDLDSQDYLEELLSYGVKRVVVKRHPRSPELLKGVTAKFEGKNVRYDLYCP